MIYNKNKLITLNSKYGIQQNGTYKSNLLLGGILIICRVEDRIWSFRNIIETAKATTNI